jgi:hypothetical protein
MGRRNIILVCKHWYDLGLSLLYARVLIESNSQYALFAETMLKDAETVATGQTNRHLGSYTRRLHIRTPTITEQLDVDAVAHAFRLCNNLDSLVVEEGRKTSFGGSLVREIMTANPSLRHFRWRTEEFTQLAQYLQSMRSLLVLDLSFYTVCHFEPLQFLPPLSFPQLHTIVIGSSGDAPRSVNYLSQWDMPALQRFVVETTPFLWWSIRIPFLQISGLQITHLDLGASARLLGGDLGDILRNLTHLRELSASFLAAVEGVNASRHDTLEKISIHLKLADMIEVYDDAMILDIMKHLGYFMNMAFMLGGSALKVLRFINLDMVDFKLAKWDNAQIGRWGEWIGKWRERDVRFEFTSGDLVRLPNGLEIDKFGEEGLQSVDSAR